MNRVGLTIQFEKVDNYGTVLQALATKLKVEELGYDARLIRYQKKYTPKFIVSQIPRVFEKANWLPLIRKMRMRKGTVHSKTFVDYQSAKTKAFSDFRKDRFPEQLIDTFYGFEALKAGSSSYDSILVGSDQLWLPEGVKSNFYNLMFVDDSVNKISYATSFGVSTIPKRQENEYRRYLKRFNSLSVREESGCKIVKKLTNREAYLACDPVMLLNDEQWSIITEPFQLPDNVEAGKYIFAYFLGVDENIRLESRKLAQALGLKLVSLIHLEDYCAIDDTSGVGIAPKGVRPEVFVNLIKNSAGVVTDSFHGTAFSIIFGKQFITTYRWNNSVHSKNTRIDNILGRFHLENRLYFEGNMDKMMNAPIDYEHVQDALEIWRFESINYLKSSLNPKDLQIKEE